jgi:hypothetical protein
MDYCVFSKSLAYHLRLQGFRIKRAAPNKKKPEDDVYYFENTKELVTAIQNYISISRKHKEYSTNGNITAGAKTNSSREKI